MCWKRPEAVERGFLAFGFQPDSFWTIQSVAAHWEPEPQPFWLKTSATVALTPPLGPSSLEPKPKKSTTLSKRPVTVSLALLQMLSTIFMGTSLATLVRVDSPKLPNSFP